jgi:putative SOS response-associated peptidase YedK
MCGGYTVTKSISALTLRFHARLSKTTFTPRFNARPSQNLPIILNTAPDQIVMAHWGIKPIWAVKEGLKKEIINTRSESFLKPTFKHDFESRRCLIPADGYYEWQATPNGKQPYRFKLKNDELFAFAGIYEQEKETGLLHFSIITTEPNKTAASIHNRMPAILLPENESKWLNPDITIDHISDLITPYPKHDLVAYPVSKKINYPGNEGPELVEPLSSGKPYQTHKLT